MEISPSREIVKRLQRKIPVASTLSSKDWSGIPLALRDRSLWTATIDDLKTVQSIGNKLDEWADYVSKDPDRALMNKGKFVSEMRQELGAEPGDTGDITDITSQRRLELIWDMQTQSAAEYAGWKWGQDEAILDAFPAQELLRIESRMVPRGFKRGKGGAIVEDPGASWPERWEAAGGTITDGRMIALKDDTIWETISAFGTPFPPFDWNSGFGVQDVDREEAESLGLIEPQETVEPREQGFNDEMAASAEGLDKEYIGLLREWFPDQIKVSKGTISWRNR